MRKLLSIIVPVYNNISITSAIDSIVKTDSVELIVVDGASSSETLNAINSRKSKIDILISEPDKGISDAINKGISVSSGKWIFVLAADDQLICDPIEIISKYDDGITDIISGSLIGSTIDNRYFISTSSKNLDMLYLVCSLRHPSSFFKKTLYSRFGMYDLNFKCANDHEIFLRFFVNGARIKVIDELIVFFRFGGISTTTTLCFFEDVVLSDFYKVPFYKSRFLLLKNLTHYYLSIIVKMLKISHKTNLLDKAELINMLKDHTEVINHNWIL